MVELAALDREKYRELRAEAWECVVAAHAEKTDEDKKIWSENAS